MSVTTGPASVGDIPHLEAWLTTLADELGVDVTSIDFAALLDATRDIAHQVARPAVPLTTLLIGIAAARDGADGAAVQSAVDRAQALAVNWAPGKGGAPGA